jgi:hypothetical protein
VSIRAGDVVLSFSDGANSAPVTVRMSFALTRLFKDNDDQNDGSKQDREKESYNTYLTTLNSMTPLLSATPWPLALSIHSPNSFFLYS